MRSASCRYLQILVIEGTGHAFNLVGGDAEAGRGIAPTRDRRSDLRRYRTGIFLRHAEHRSNLEGRVERRCSIDFVDRKRVDAWLTSVGMGLRS